MCLPHHLPRYARNRPVTKVAWPEPATGPKVIFTAPSGTASHDASIERGTPMGTQLAITNPTWVLSTSAAEHGFTADFSFEPKRLSEPPL